MPLQCGGAACFRYRKGVGAPLRHLKALMPCCLRFKCRKGLPAPLRYLKALRPLQRYCKARAPIGYLKAPEPFSARFKSHMAVAAFGVCKHSDPAMQGPERFRSRMGVAAPLLCLKALNACKACKARFRTVQMPQPGRGSLVISGSTQPLQCQVRIPQAAHGFFAVSESIQTVQCKGRKGLAAPLLHLNALRPKCKAQTPKGVAAPWSSLQASRPR